LKLSDSIRAILFKHSGDIMGLTRDFDARKIESLDEFGKQKGILIDSAVTQITKLLEGK